MARKRRGTSQPAGEGEARERLHSLIELIREGEPVLFLTGSGLSAPSGIPTFRGEDNSVWAQYVTECVRCAHHTACKHRCVGAR